VEAKGFEEGEKKINGKKKLKILFINGN